MGYLGGWTRSFDSATYGPGYTCPPGTPTAVQCQAATPIMHAGLLDQAGWDLLDDTQSAQWTAQGWVEPRPAGRRRRGRLPVCVRRQFPKRPGRSGPVDGPAPHCCRSPFSASGTRIFTRIRPRITRARWSRSSGPIMSPWTRYRSTPTGNRPNQWDGWEWNPALFPDPQAFLQYAQSQGINVTLNIHSSISTSDPRAFRSRGHCRQQPGHGFFL